MRTLRLAEQLGADVVTIPGTARRIADDVLAYAHETNATHIILGKSTRSRFFEVLNGSVVHDLVRRAGDISVHVIAGQDQGDARPPSAPRAGAAGSLQPWPLVAAAAGVAAALGVSILAHPVIGVESVDLIFLTAVVGLAVRFGLWPSLLAVVLASLCYNFFFLPPVYTFTVADPRNVSALVMFTLVAVLVSNLAARARQQALSAQSRSRTTEALYSFSRKLAGCGTLDDVLWATTYQMASMLKVRVVILLPSPEGIAVRAGYPPEDSLDDADVAAAKWAFEHDRSAGRGADTLPGAKRVFLPMHTGRGVIGVVGLDDDRTGPILTPEKRRLFDALSDQASLAIERVHLVEDLDRAERLAETDRLRQALLTSISHDLKTPLSAVLGAAGAMRDLDANLAPADKSELLDTVIAESERLNRFIANLLDMTKLESGAIAPNLALHDVGEIVGSALARASKILARRRVEVELAADLPMLSLDAVLFEQILFNLLDNAAKYSGEDTTIRIESWRAGGTLRLQILDEGTGIPDADCERIFDKFYRARKSDAVRAGTGLGLAISRGFVEAMGGTITAANRKNGGGAAFTLTLPVPAGEKQLDHAA